MKKTFFLCIIASLFLAACQQTPEPVTVDLEAEEAAAREMLSGFIDAITTQNVDTMTTFIADDALICGTDPTEFLNKEEMIKVLRELASGPEIDFLFLEEHPFKIAPDGNSAIYVSQFYVPMMLPNIPVRHVYYLTKVEGKWMISFWSSSLIPENEDLMKIVESVAEEESTE